MNQPTIDYRLHPTKSPGAEPISNGWNSNSDSTDWSGRVFGEYEVQCLVGQGGNGRVYRAQHRWLELPVAIKVLQHVNTNDERMLDRFRREAQIAARLRHPNLVRCTDGGVVGDKLFLVTDYIDGEDLRKLVQRNGALSVADACEVIRQTAIALQFIVENDTIHRDIKPANIMLERDGNVRVLDMGLARCTLSGETLTETGQVMGTLDYIAPEQAVDARHVDFRADLYSLGCTFYFLLTGKAPFASDENETVASKVLAHLESEPPPIKHFRRDVPRAVIELIDQMLSKSPDLRPKSFDIVREKLKTHSQRHNVSKLFCETAKPDGERARQSLAGASNLAERMGSGLRTATTTVFRIVLVGLGILDRTPPSRPGQRANYHFSLRWLKTAVAIGAIAAVVWYSGFSFFPADQVVPPQVQTPGIEKQESIFTPPSQDPRLPPPPHMRHLSGPGSRPHPPMRPQPPGHSPGLKYNDFR